jgi:hypothetical protein
MGEQLERKIDRGESTEDGSIEARADGKSGAVWLELS